MTKLPRSKKVEEKTNNGKCRLYITREYICNGKSGRGHNQVSLHSPVNFHSQEKNTILINKMHLYTVQTFLKIVIIITIIINKIIEKIEHQ